MDIGSEVLSSITIFGKYAKYLDEVQRRETWDEIVDRYEIMMMKKFPSLKKEILEKSQFIRDKKVLPSMRAMQFAGIAMEVNNARGYNCAYLPVDSIYSFSETMFLLLGGSGVGYSVQNHHIDQLPTIKKPTKTKKYLVGDSIIGWADAVKALMKAYLMGKALPDFDFRDIRPKGARLITAGGKAPGPEPLKECLIQIKNILDRKKDGEKLNSIECHDILCHIANSVLAGGIRRSAMICLFDMDDEYMISCKSNFTVLKWKHKVEEHRVPGTEQVDHIVVEHVDTVTGDKYYDLTVTVLEDYYGVRDVDLFWVSERDMKMLKEEGRLPWYHFQEQRGRSNNSVVLVRGEVSDEQFWELWKRVKESGAGEPGFYWTNNREWGTNPCCEIALRCFQFCNLCEINISNVISQEDLNERTRVAAFFGTLQASFTDFHYLRPIWRKTTEADALLGIGQTGIASRAYEKCDLSEAALLAVEENNKYASVIGINPAARVTTVKPSGTTSCVLGTSSGIHAWHNDYYLRTIRFNKTEAIAQYLMTNHPELCEDDLRRPFDTVCVRIPIKAPEGSILRTESALETLNRVKHYATNWVQVGHKHGDNTHNVSATISIKENEWQEVGQWMLDNKEYYNGLSVLPYNGGTYQQAPFEDITREEYEAKIVSLKTVDLTKVIEIEDSVNFGQIASCAGGKCDLEAA